MIRILTPFFKKATIEIAVDVKKPVITFTDQTLEDAIKSFESRVEISKKQRNCEKVGEFERVANLLKYAASYQTCSLVDMKWDKALLLITFEFSNLDEMISFEKNMGIAVLRPQ